MSGVNLGSAWGKIEISTDQAEQSVSSLADSMRKAGTAMSLGVTAPLVGIAATAVSSAADFEQSLNIMAQVSGATADQMAGLQAQALEMGAVTSFSAGEAAQAQLELAKAGLSVNDIIAATPGVLDMAAAGGMGLAESAEIAANAMNAFNLPASEMPNIANMLAAAANASSVDISDLAAAMKMSGAVFASNKQPMDDMVTALAMLGNAGLKGSDAGTSLKTMLLSLASPTDKAHKAMNAIGLSVYDASGNMRGFSDIMSDLSGITADMTDAERNNALSVIFGSDAIRAATIISRDYGESWDGISDALGDGSAAANVAGARMRGMNGAIEYLKGSIDSFLIGAALPYLDMMGNFVRMTADGLTAIGSLPRPLMDAAVAFGAVLAAAGPVMLAIAGITAAIGFLLSPVGLLVAGVAAVAAGFVLWQQNFGNVQGRAAALAGMLKDMAENATGIDFDAIGEGVRSFGNYIGAVLEDGDYLNDWLTHLPESVQPAAEAFGRFVAAVGELWKTGDIGAFVQELRDMFPEAAAAVDGAVGGVTKAIGEISDAITAFRDGNLDVPELIWNIANALIGDGANYYVIRDAVNAIGAAWQSVQGAALAMWTWLQVAIPAAVEAMRSAWATAWPAIQEAFSAAWGTVSGGLAAAWTWLQVALPAALGWLQSTWTAVWPAIQEATSAAWEAIQPALAAAWAWLQVAIPAALAWLRSAWEAAWPAMQAAWDAVWTPLSAAWTTVKAWLDTTLPAALTALKTAWEQTWPALQTASSTAWEGIKGTFDNLKAAFTGMQTGASQVSGTLAGFWAQVSTIGAMLAAFFAPAMERLQAAFSKLPESLAPLMPKLQALGEAFGGLFQALQPFVLLVGAALAIAVDFGINRLTTVFETLPGILGPVIDQITATIKLITVILTETVTAVKAVIDGDWATVWESAKTIAGGFSTFFRGLFSRLGTFMMAVAVNMTQPVIDTLRDLGVDVDPILNGIKKTFETIWGGIQSAIQAVIDIVGTLTDTFSGFKSFLDGLSLNNPFAPLVDAYNTIAGGITKIGTPGGMDNDPNTPWRGGTSYYPGGIGMMNEVAGLSETVILPAGSRIMTAAQSNQQGAGGQPPQITVNMGGVTIANDMDVQRIGWGLANQIAAALG